MDDADAHSGAHGMLGRFLCGADPDDIFAYHTPRYAKIRDSRLGCTYLAATVAIGVYIIIYQVILSQAYYLRTSVSGSTRLTIAQPTAPYRWPNGGAPYCTGVTAASLANLTQEYTFPSPGSYKYVNTPVTGAQYQCKYIDQRYAVPNTLEVNALFFPTRTTTVAEQVTPLPLCANLNESSCTWATVNSSVWLTIDAEMYTLLIDHSFTTEGGDARGQAQMQGTLLKGTERVDPCEAYRTPRFNNAPCFSSISLGAGKGLRDIVALRTLLNAAGVPTLDSVTGTVPSLRTQTMRYSGIVMYIHIEYTNYYGPGSCVSVGTGTFDPNEVQYVMRTYVVPETEFKSEETIAEGVFPGTSRTTYNRHGVRFIVVQGGCVGQFSFQQLLINLTVSLSLLSVAAVVTNFIAFNACPLRNVYKSYAYRTTVDFSDIRDVVTPELLDSFSTNPYQLQPMPHVFHDLFEQQKRLQVERCAVLEAARAATNAAAKDAGVGATAEYAASSGAGDPATLLQSPPAAPASGSGVKAGSYVPAATVVPMTA